MGFMDGVPETICAGCMVSRLIVVGAATTMMAVVCQVLSHSLVGLALSDKQGVQSIKQKNRVASLFSLGIFGLVGTLYYDEWKVIKAARLESRAKALQQKNKEDEE